MKSTLNYRNGRYTANETIDKFILGREHFTHEFISDDAVPRCDVDKKVIYSPVFPPIINPEQDTIVRAKNEHEAGHGRFTPGNKSENWSPVKMNLMNVLEDLRVEKGLKRLSDAFIYDLETFNRTMINKINNKNYTEGYNGKPVNEALLILLMNGNGFSPMWKVSEMAEKMVSSVIDDFNAWKDADCKTKAGFDELEKIADIILKKWSDMLPTIEDNSQSSSDGNSSEQNGEEAGENEENNNASSENGNEEEDGNANGEEEDGNSSASNSENGEEEGEEKDGKSSANGEENEEAGEKDEDGEENGKSSNENGENSSASDSENGEEDGEEYGEENSDANNGSGDKKSPTLEDFFDETKDDMNEEIKKTMEDIIKDADKVFGEYRAYTDEDVVQKSEEDMYKFDAAKKDISGAIATFSGYLENSLRSMSRCRKITNRDRGILDVNALPAFAKNLTRNVFYNKKQGISLDTTVSILIDESGSMWENGKYLSCRSVAIALAEVLYRLGIDFEILGHTTGSIKGKYENFYGTKFDRKKAMVIYEHKCFNEPYVRVKNRLGCIDNYNCNIDGEALLYTYKRAMQQRSNRHIILVLSDGLPSGTVTAKVGAKHLKMVVDFCRTHGAEVYGFGIHTDNPEMYYGKEYFVYLKDKNSFNTDFFRKVSDIIAKK